MGGKLNEIKCGQVIKEAAKAIAAMPFLVLQPLWTFAFICVLYVWTVRPRGGAVSYERGTPVKCRVLGSG
jgi:hypothetical protein